MSTRDNRRWKIPDRLTVSRETALELCRRPAVLAIFGCLTLAAGLTIWGMKSNSNSVTDADLTDEQLESDFLALGALGVSDSANPGSNSVNTEFDFGDDTPETTVDAAPPIFSTAGGFLDRATVSSSEPDFEPEFESDMPRFGKPITQPAIRQTGFEQSEPSYSTASGARVTANQAVWLTGSIETR